MGGELLKNFINNYVVALNSDEDLQKDPKVMVFSQEFFTLSGTKEAVAELAVLNNVLRGINACKNV